MLTKAEITAASTTLDETDQAMWLALFRANSFYRANKLIYPDLEATLDDANGSVKAAMLNATLDRIEALGVGQVQIKNGDEGLNYSQDDERNALVTYGLSILYDTILIVPQINANTGQFGNVQVRQRWPACPVCSLCGYAHSGNCSWPL